MCNPGFVGDGITCTRAFEIPKTICGRAASLCHPNHARLAHTYAECFGSNVCGPNIMCLGGTTCGTTCNPGYTYDGTACVRTFGHTRVGAWHPDLTWSASSFPLRQNTSSADRARGHCPAVHTVLVWLPRHPGVLGIVRSDVQRCMHAGPDVLERQLRHVPGCPHLLLLPPDVPMDRERESERKPAQRQHPGVAVLLSARRGMLWV